MSIPILTFNAKSVSGDILEKTLVGRREIVDEIFKELSEKSVNLETYQSLLIAPRGSGKTHITKVIYCRLDKNEELKDKVLVAYMIEDEYGIVNFTHLCIQILYALKRYNQVENEDIDQKIREISQAERKQQEYLMSSYLRSLIGNKVLVVLIENLDIIFKGMGKSVAKLRDFMHEYNNISLVATAQNLTPQFKGSQEPFYHFFKTRHLQRLDLDQCYQLILSLIEVEQDQELKEKLLQETQDSTEIKSKIRAIYQLTFGNHRLIVHFFSFLKVDLKAELSVVFNKQMNDLKSYYEQFVKALSIQQQRIVQLLSISHSPLKGKDIAQKTFLSSTVVSKQMSQLSKMGYIDKHRSGKDAFYELKEPLMRICFEINEDPEGVAKLFINFLKVAYDDRERQRKYLFYKYGSKFHPVDLAIKHKQESNLYEKSLSRQEVERLKTYEQELEECPQDKFKDKIEEILSDSDDFENQCRFLAKHGEFDRLNDVTEKWIKFEENDNSFYWRAYASHNLKEYSESIKYYELINSHGTSSYNNLGNAYLALGSVDKAIKNYKKAISLDPNSGTVYTNWGILYETIEDYEKAEVYYKKAIIADPNYELSYLYLGDIYKNQMNYQKAIEYLQKSITINSNNAAALFNFGNLYNFLGFNIQASEYYKRAIVANPNLSSAYNNLGNAQLHLNEVNLAKQNIDKAIEQQSNHPHYLGSLTGYCIHIQDWRMASNQLTYIFNQQLEYNHILWSQDVMLNIAQWAPLHLLEKWIVDCEEFMKNHDKSSFYYLSFSNTVFSLLRDIESKSQQKMETLLSIFQSRYSNIDSVKIPLLMFDVGIDYLIKENDRALFRLSKEEREAFQEFVLTPRKQIQEARKKINLNI